MFDLSANCKRHYIPPSSNTWAGRSDGENALHFHEAVQLFDLNKEWPKAHAFALIGFQSDVGILRNQGRKGAKDGPSAFRQALGALPAPADLSLFDVGDIAVQGDDLESAQQALAEVISHLLKLQIQPLLIGGGHEMAFGHYQGVMQAFPQLDLGIVNFDAYFDMRSPLLEEGACKGTSGSSFLQIAKERQREDLEFDYTCIGIQTHSNTKALFDQARSQSVITVRADEIHRKNIHKLLKTLDQLIAKRTALFVTISLDVFASCYAPGVSAPSPLGLTPWQVIPLLERLAYSEKVIGFEIAELSPPYDRDGMTAKLAALLMTSFLSIALNPKAHS
ncbi:MAG: hutG 2 [Chlamydiales bacterium]|nr:hutG 2 [Chlamydiales bacterium]